MREGSNPCTTQIATSVDGPQGLVQLVVDEGHLSLHVLERGRVRMHLDAELGELGRDLRTAIGSWVSNPLLQPLWEVLHAHGLELDLEADHLDTDRPPPPASPAIVGEPVTPDVIVNTEGEDAAI